MIRLRRRYHFFARIFALPRQDKLSNDSVLIRCTQLQHVLAHEIVVVVVAVGGVLAAHARTVGAALDACTEARAVALATVRSTAAAYSLRCKGVWSCFDYCLSQIMELSS